MIGTMPIRYIRPGNLKNLNLFTQIKMTQDLKLIYFSSIPMTRVKAIRMCLLFQLATMIS